MPRLLHLNQALCTVIIDGTPDVLHMDGDSVRVIPTAEGSAVTVGFSGASTSFSNDESGTVEQDFQQTSPSLDKYLSLWKQQKTAAARRLSGTIVTATGSVIRLEGVSIADIGQTPVGGKQQTGRTVVFNVERITEAGF